MKLKVKEIKWYHLDKEISKKNITTFTVPIIFCLNVLLSNLTEISLFYLELVYHQYTTRLQGCYFFLIGGKYIKIKCQILSRKSGGVSAFLTGGYPFSSKD